MTALDTVHEKLAPLLPGHDPARRLAGRLEELHHHLHTRAVRSFDSRRDLLNGYSYDVFYDWDAYFENCYLSHLHEPRFCRSTTEAFLDQQLENGFVSRSLGLPRLRQHFKPFLAQMVWLGVRQGVDPNWLRGRYWERLVKYVDHWVWFRDHDRNGLSVWDSADHSGMDNQNRRAGEYHSDTVEGVDLNVYIAREHDALALLADRLGEAGEAEIFRAAATERRRLINELLWDEEAGFYLDRHERTQALQRVFTVAGFLPLWDGTATPERAGRLVREHLTDPERFWLPHPVATWSKQEPDHYQMRRGHECTWLGATWVPTNYMVFHGLRRYGFDDVAEDLAYRTCAMALNEATTREFYNAETGAGQGLDPFWGWSALAYAMPLEFETQTDPTALNADEPHRPLLTELVGLENPMVRPFVTPARPGNI
ncbi:MGH1-like glycoside hydrolase domain-containing protein [Phycisphaera mikurensis]|uniref:Putative glycoside hydrolase n=1 Tax=Phycisphaera mikurensis (strain NBRC 102666 / KCTC 22515 / FYK2301M01) TaxID=1142394 RepID=I0ICR8_PHYMF|nr:trehalase family glycosidase [Phycisphaera mikurensis]MBB6442071.1 hypothetical protein [Phycisphaera mikurensis]BAM03056.1 putative glycoside hydrolase [Phycisphaera mikurensis NBRC 102666]